MLCNDHLLWEIDAAGSVQLKPVAVKTALDGKLTRTGCGPDSVEARTVPGTDHVGAEESFDPSMREAGRDEVDPLANLADLDLVRRVREIIEVRRASAHQGSGRWWILRNMAELMSGRARISDLVAASGLSDSALHEAYQCELAAMREAFRAA